MNPATNLFIDAVLVGAVLVLPVALAQFLVRKLRMPDYTWKVWLILFAVMASFVITLRGWPPKRAIDLAGGSIMVFEVDKDQSNDDDSTAWGGSGFDMDRLIAAIVRRVNPDGLKEVVVRRYGEDKIEIIVPEVDQEETQRLKERVSALGTLEFRIVANRTDHEDEIALAERPEMENSSVVRGPGDEIIARWVPVEPRVQQNFAGNPKFATRVRTRGGREIMEMLVVSDPYEVTGDQLRLVTAGVDQKQGRPCVNFTFKSQGAFLFGQLTSNNLPDPATNFQRNLAILLDNSLYSAPSIISTITDRGQITGDFSEQEVDDLVSVLNAGSLPAALKPEPVSEQIIGPTLGRDTIRMGQMAMLVSMTLVLLFMLAYYHFAGIVACLALVTNLLLVLALLITFKAAVSLPGLAGLVLTVGMAVDANVLIFERIREERSRGAALRMAIRNGFDRATNTIVDANLTTLITGVVLFWIGTDQVKGFAVILILGILMSMFTAIFCSRVVFEIAERSRWIENLSMLRMFGATSINFLNRRRLAFGLSMVAILVGLGGVFLRGENLLDIDFTGGTSIQVAFKPQHSQQISDVRRMVEGRWPNVAVSDLRAAPGEASGLSFLINTQDDNEDRVRDGLHELFGDMLASNSLVSTTFLGDTAAGSPQGPSLTAPDTNDSDGEAIDTGSSGADEDGAAAETPDASTPAEESSDAKAADAPPTDQRETTVSLQLARKIDRESLRVRTRRALALSASGGVVFDITNPGYVEGDSESFDTWVLAIDLPREETEAVLAAVNTGLLSDPYFPSVTNVGQAVAGEAQKKALIALVASLLCIVGYIWFRFQRVIFGLAAVVALVHDVLITLGALALSYFVADALGFLLIDPFKISLPIVAAFLTIIGYSLNDTIVVFDRIREVRGKSPDLTPDMINLGINQTLGRTLLTSLTTLIVVAILYVAGGPGIHGFAFALVVGVTVGTYSSIFVASPILLLLHKPRTSGSRRSVPAVTERSTAAT